MLSGGFRGMFGAVLVVLMVSCNLGSSDTSTDPAPVAASIPKAPANASGADYPPPPPGLATPRISPPSPGPAPTAPIPKDLESPFDPPPPPPTPPVDAGGGTQL